jgi:hypothetical protein
MKGGPGGRDTPERRLWLLQWLVNAEQHRTAELQSQQARVTTILAANTFLLGLLATAALEHQFSRNVADALLVAIAFASVALLAALVALFPLNPPDNPHYLDRAWLSERVNDHCEDDLLTDLIGSLVPKRDPLGTIRFRRWVLRIQLVMLGIGTGAALVAVWLVLK